LLHTIVVKSIKAIDVSAFVIAAEKEEVLGVQDLVTEEKADGLNALEASVDVITEEKIIGIRWILADVKKTQEIVELAMRVATDGDRRPKLKEDRLLKEYRPHAFTQELELVG
jgi:hypothetical protein